MKALITLLAHLSVGLLDEMKIGIAGSRFFEY